jgi:hypothetical protein
VNRAGSIVANALLCLRSYRGFESRPARHLIMSAQQRKTVDTPGLTARGVDSDDRGIGTRPLPSCILTASPTQNQTRLDFPSWAVGRACGNTCERTHEKPGEKLPRGIQHSWQPRIVRAAKPNDLDAMRRFGSGGRRFPRTPSKAVLQGRS